MKTTESVPTLIPTCPNCGLSTLRCLCPKVPTIGQEIAEMSHRELMGLERASSNFWERLASLIDNHPRVKELVRFEYSLGELERFSALVEQLVADKERLDWMEINERLISENKGKEFVHCILVAPEHSDNGKGSTAFGDTLREAIDAAMAQHIDAALAPADKTEE